MSTVNFAQGDDTWGISGPAFLEGYLIVGSGLWLGVLITLFASGNVRSGASGRLLGKAFSARFPRPASSPDGDPYLVAYLNGGPKLAVLAGQSALRAAGQLGADAPTEPATHPKWPLELAILAATDRPAPYAQLKSDRAVTTALRALSDELVRAKLLVSGCTRLLMRCWRLMMLGLFALGLWRLVDGLRNGQPIRYLVVLVLAVGVGVGLWYLRRLRRLTEAGLDALGRLHRMHSYLHPALFPDRTANGPSAAAIGAGLFGAGAIWSADPELAGGWATSTTVAVSRWGAHAAGGALTASGSSTGYVCSSGSGGGGGGCGGGGGGGCGGGGRGCGG